MKTELKLVIIGINNAQLQLRNPAQQPSVQLQQHNPLPDGMIAGRPLDVDAANKKVGVQQLRTVSEWREQPLGTILDEVVLASKLLDGKQLAAFNAITKKKGKASAVCMEWAEQIVRT